MFNILIQIIYASTSGNVEAVCQKISDILETHNFRTTLQRAESTNFSVISDNNKFIFATSTWEHGEINPFFNKLLQEMMQNNLSGKTGAFVGLGDTRYEQMLFCKGAEILREAFLKGGGKELSTMLKINGEPYGQMDTLVTTWTNRLIDLLNSA